MIETITIATLSLLLLAYLRPGKVEPLASPLNIHRAGQFHAVLAPMLNLAQPLLVGISNQLNDKDRVHGNTKTIFVKVTDKEVMAHGASYYLLAVTLRNGIMYFQATAPTRGENDFSAISTFSDAEMIKHPPMQDYYATEDTALMLAIKNAAAERNAIVSDVAKV